MKNISACIIILSIFSFIPTYSSIKTRLHAYQNPLPEWKDSNNIIQTKKRIFEVSPDPNIVKVVVVGDIMMTRDVAKKIAENNHDYTFPFQKIKPELEGSDLKIANLEGGITDSSIIQKGVTPCKNENAPTNCCGMSCHFKNPPDILHGVVAYAGFNVLGLANNHMEDFVHEQSDTHRVLEKYGVPFIDNDSNLIIESLKNCQITLHAYNLIGHIDFVDRKRKIILSLQSMPEDAFNIVYFHGGLQYSHNITDQQIEFGEAAIDSGADMVIFTHAHVIEPYTIYKGKYIHYGIGNIIFDHDSSMDDTRNFIMLKFDLFNCRNVINYRPLNGRINDDYQAELLDDGENIQEKL